MLCMILLWCGQILCLPGGPPTELNGVATNICTDLKPIPTSPHQPQSGDGGFSIYSNLPTTSISLGAFYTFSAGATYNGKYIANLKIWL